MKNTKTASRVFTAGALCTLAFAAATQAHAGLLSKLASGGASAASSPRERKTYDAGTLSPGALRLCLLKAYQIDNVSDELERDHKALEAERAELRRMAQPLKGAGEKDKRVIEYLAREKAFNARVDAFNRKPPEAKGMLERFRRECDDKKYFASDLQAVRGSLPQDVLRAMKQP